MTRRQGGRLATILIVAAILGAVFSLPAHAKDIDAHGSVAGLVLSEDGLPVAGAEVVLQKTDPGRWSLGETAPSIAAHFEPRKVFKQSVRTGADGRFQFVGLEAGASYALHAQSSKPLGAAGSNVSTTPGRPPTTRLVLRPGRRVSGRLVGAQGKPLRGSLVAYTQSHGQTFTGSRGYASVLLDHPTDDEGRFEFVAPASEWVRIESRVPGVGARTISVDPGVGPVDVEVSLRLRQGCTAHGRVTDVEGAPARGALVLVSVRQGQHTAWLHRTLAVTRTTADGRWRVVGLPEGIVTQVAAWSVGSAVFNVPVMQAPLRRDHPLAADVVLCPGARLSGRVLAAEGLPVVGARVTCAQAGAYPYAHAAPSAVTDAEGRYHFDNVPLVPGSLAVWHDEYTLPMDEQAQVYARRLVSTFGRPRPGEEVVRDLHVVSGGIFRGRAVDADGRPVEGVQAALTTSHGMVGQSSRAEVTRTAWSDAEGRFEIRGVPKGASHLLSLTAEGFDAVASRVVLPTVKGTAPPQFVLPPATVLAGRVIDAEGRPLRAVVVGIGGTLHKTQTDAQGRFRLHARAAGTTMIYAGQAYPPLVSLVIGVEPGTRRENLELRWPAGGSLGGVVVDAAGQPVAEVPVTLRAAANSQRRADTWTDSTGRWRIDHVPAGRYGVFVGHAWPAQVEAEPGNVELHLVHKRPTVEFFDGLLLDPDGKPVPRATIAIAAASDGVHVSRALAHVIGGHFRVTRPAGLEGALSLRVQAAHDDFGRLLNVQPRRLLVDAETPRPVRFELVRGREVRGRVVDGEQRPVAGLGLTLYPAKAASGVSRSQPLRAHTDADGRFRFVGVGEGAMLIGYPWSAAYSYPAPTPVVAGVEDVVITVKRWRTIRGTVLDMEGRPAAGVAVQLGKVPFVYRRQRAAVTTDEEGRFVFQRVLRGAPHAVMALPRKEADAGAQPCVVSGVEAGAEDVVVRLTKGLTITGVVRGTDDEPVVGCLVSSTNVLTKDLKHPAWYVRPSTTTGEDGRFVLGVFAEGTVAHLAFRTPSDAKVPYFAETRSSVPAGTQDLDLRMERGVMLTGTVEGVEAARLKGLTLSAYPADAKVRKSQASYKFKGKSNRFRLGPVHPGGHKIKPRMSRGGGLFFPREIKAWAPGEPVLIQVTRSWNLTGKILAKNPRGFVVSFDQPGRSKLTTTVGSTTGLFRIARLRETPGTLYVHRADSDLTALVENVIPSAKPLEVTLAKGLTISGRVVDLPRKLRKGRIRATRGGVSVESEVADDGWFETRPLPAGAWTLEVIARSFPREAFIVPGPVAAGSKHVLIPFLRPK